MITVAGSERGPGSVGPGAVIRIGCADCGGGAKSKHRMGPGNGGPDSRRGLAVSLAEKWRARHGDRAREPGSADRSTSLMQALT